MLDLLRPRTLIVASALMALDLVAGAQSPPPADPARLTFTDVTAAAGIRFVHNSGATGKKYLPETMGSGVAFLDADGDGLAGSVLRQLQELAGSAGQALASRALSQHRQGHVRRRHPRRRAGGGALRAGRRGRRLRQRRRRRSVRDGARGQPPVPQRGQRRVHRRHCQGRRRRLGLLDQRRVGRLRQGRLARPGRAQLRGVVDRDRSLLLLRRHEQVLLHARSLQGRESPGLPQPRATARSRT